MVTVECKCFSSFLYWSVLALLHHAVDTLLGGMQVAPNACLADEALICDDRKHQVLVQQHKLLEGLAPSQISLSPSYQQLLYVGNGH